MRGDLGLRAGRGGVAEVLLVGITRVFVIVAVETQQFPVGAIFGVVVMVVIAMVHGQLADALTYMYLTPLFLYSWKSSLPPPATA